MVFLDGTIVNVALPRIQQDFETTVTGLQWLVNIYILFLTVPILVTGSLSDRYGRRKLYNIGLVGFAVASVGCGAAVTMEQLLLARVFQGIFGAIMLPGSLAILNATFPPEMRGRVVGTWSAFTPITTAIGPLLGGWLVDNVSWRAAFYINVPMALITLYLSLRYIPESKSDKMPKKQDWLGAILIILGLGGLIYGLIEGPELGWTNPIVMGTLLAGTIFMVAFFIVEASLDHPMIPLKLFKHRAFSGVTLMTFVLYFAMSGVFFFFTLNLQQIQGMTATQAGLAFMPIIVLLFIMSRWAGGVADKTGPRNLMIIGPVLIAIGFFMYIIPGTNANYWLTFFPATVVFGVGLGITVAPLTTVALASVPTHLSGLASGVSNAVSRVGTMLAVAMLGAIMVNQFGVSLHRYTDPLDLDAETRALLEGEVIELGGAEAPSTELVRENVLLQSEINEYIELAFVDAFRLMMAVCGALALLGTVVAFVAIPNGVLRHHVPLPAMVSPPRQSEAET